MKSLFIISNCFLIDKDWWLSEIRKKKKKLKDKIKDYKSKLMEKLSLTESENPF